KLTQDGAELGGARVPLTREVIAAADGDTVTLGFRPESLEVSTEEGTLPVKVDLVEELGSDAYVYGKLTESDAEGTKSNIVARAYGHGALPVARAAVEAGATWLGTCSLAEALELRRAGITARLLSWLDVPGVDFESGIAEVVDLAASSVGELHHIAAAASRAG